ncbi:MAG: hypothetical protein P8X42_00635 [Calditrichaceae bacterium]|jgi:ABC-type dipeptide/oligopeptide/nickel transport system permease component
MKSSESKFKAAAGNVYSQKDKLWILIWITVIGLVTIWDLLFLNKPAFKLITEGSVNTVIISLFVVLFSFLSGWLVSLVLVRLESAKMHIPYLLVTFFLNIIRSVPQIIGILFGYIAITYLVTGNIFASKWLILISMAFVISIFIFAEVVDLIRERINHFKKLDFYNAMKVCGISENRIINYDILWKNSRIHILNKLIGVFGSAVFLLCTVDFIISVGLSTQVSSVSLPVTLGSLLAKIDSKQDILAIGNTLSDPGYISHIFFEHLQGVTVAFLIVFTLICVYKISNGFAGRKRI